MSERLPISSTYRLQLHAAFGFAEATTIVEYLDRLGVSHLYLSPILQAAPGSMHGYDVVDHTLVSRDLGGQEGLRQLADEAHRHGMGLVVDVVPNHMSFPARAYLNPVWWEVLRDGRRAARAHWFDIDWELCDGKVGLPILGSSLDEALELGQFELGDHAGHRFVRYFDQILPLASGTESGSVADVLARQHYVLASWRDKDAVLGYRRFFDVDTLVAVRVELPDVFAETHEVLLGLHSDGVIDGFRIDHPDGLADPQGYLDALAEATDGAWVVVEKILAPGEQLPRTWKTAGTTGYDAIRVLQTALAPPTGTQLTEQWSAIDESSLDHTELVAKQTVLRDLLQPELRRLVRRAAAAQQFHDHHGSDAELTDALSGVLTRVDRYRAYLRLGSAPDPTAVGRLDQWTQAAADDRPDLAEALVGVRDLLTDTEARDDATTDLVIRFQQVCGPVMAKGVEDTTFYRWHRFIALNEVGGDPAGLDSPGLADLHDWAARQAADHPAGMTTLSTHDTKRDEDVRARLLAAGEDVGSWTHVWALVRDEADHAGVDAPTAYLVFQTLLGAWPISKERADGYLVKAVRESKLHTRWTDPDEEYEKRVVRLAETCRNEGPVASAIDAWIARIAAAERATNLSAKLIQLTLPGVPDVYQGCERVTRSLVDPDNRRPVDFAARAARLSAFDSGERRLGLDDDKLWLTSGALRLRKALPEAFAPGASYEPVDLGSPHLIAFIRGARVLTIATRWPLGLEHRRDDLSFRLPPGRWTDVFTGRKFQSGTSYSTLMADFPVALLLRESE